MNTELSRQVLKLPPIIGHRGACGYAPENTIESFKYAVSLGVSCVEFDVKLTADNKLVVFHDNTIDRTTSGQGPIESFSLSELQSLDAGGWFGGEFIGARVPAFSEVIELLSKSAMTANIEIKSSPGLEIETAKAVCKALKENWPGTMPPPLLSSFADEALAVAKALAPEIERALLLLEFPADWQGRAEVIGARSIHLWHKKLTGRRASRIKDAGYSLRCFTVNDAKTAQKLFDWGVDSVISDYPDRIKR